jgi:hypothetical protein
LQRIAQRLTSVIGLLPTSLGTKTAANSLAVTLASDGALTSAVGTTADAAVANGAGGTLLGMIRALKDAATDGVTPSPVKAVGNDEYETVAASQTDQVLGATGAVSDRLSHLLIVPATTSPGAVSIKDGAGSAITIFTGGASSVTNLVPFVVPLGLKSLAGPWKVTTGANVSAIGVGDFT